MQHSQQIERMEQMVKDKINVTALTMSCSVMSLCLPKCPARVHLPVLGSRQRARVVRHG